MVDQIFNKANSHSRKGNFREAEILYNSILEKFPYNLRAKKALQKINTEIISLHEQNLTSLYNDGKLLEVLNQCTILTKKFPQKFIFWKFSGMANFDTQNFYEAEICFRNAIIINNTDIDCIANLAIIYNNLGTLDQAIEMYLKAIELNDSIPELYNNLANIFKDKGDLEKALETYNKALIIKPDYFVPYYNKAIIYQNKNETDHAIEMYSKALEIQPNHIESLNNLGNVFQEKGLISKAIETFHKIISINPNFEQAYFNLGNCLNGILFQNPNCELQFSILKLLEKGNSVSPANIVEASVSLLKNDVHLKKLFETSQKTLNTKDVLNIVNNLSNNALFMKLMNVSLLQDLYVENSLKNIRNSILNNLSNIKGCSQIMNFQASLATQCFLNEYLYKINEDETKKIRKLEKQIETSILSNKKLDFSQILCIASYKPLSSFSWFNKLSFPEELRLVEKLLIKDVIEENKLKTQIACLSPINDKTSIKVQGQYEESPYPRWFDLNLGYKKSTVSDRMDLLRLKYNRSTIPNNENPNILIAGCGTGEHSIGVASTFKNSKILAIDLSLSSIAYAKRKSNELGINNIDYLQADILDLLKLNRKFDIIESAGVLHHMKDPIKGWKTLVKCLKPGGLMKIGLYSKVAREHITRIREEIKKLDLNNDKLTIREFRSRIIKSDQLDHKMITESPDFYSLSNVKDLLFHVQEYQFTLSEIKNFINNSNLVFCGFEVKNAINKYKSFHKNYVSLYDLKKWDNFEKNNKEIFAGMYQFWCQKNFD